jgi:hypothetical protein
MTMHCGQFCNRVYISHILFPFPTIEHLCFWVRQNQKGYISVYSIGLHFPLIFYVFFYTKKLRWCGSLCVSWCVIVCTAMVTLCANSFNVTYDSTLSADFICGEFYSVNEERLLSYTLLTVWVYIGGAMCSGCNKGLSKYHTDTFDILKRWSKCDLKVCSQESIVSSENSDNYPEAPYMLHRPGELLNIPWCAVPVHRHVITSSTPHNFNNI